MKKKLLALAFVLCAFRLAFAFAACREETALTTPPNSSEIQSSQRSDSTFIEESSSALEYSSLESVDSSSLEYSVLESTDSSEEGSSLESSSNEESSSEGEASTSADSSEEFPEEVIHTDGFGVQYSLSADETYYTVIGTTQALSETFTVPSSFNEIAVKEIGVGAFRGCTTLKNVLISEGITKIGGHSFYECSGLERVTIAESVTRIEANAFTGCTALTCVDFIKNAGWSVQVGGSAFLVDGLADGFTAAEYLKGERLYLDVYLNTLSWSMKN